MKKEDLRLDSSLRLLFKTSLFVFMALVISKVLSYAYRIIIAKYFGPEIYGLFSLATIIIYWFVIFALLGLSEGAIRFIALYRGKRQIKSIRYLFRISSAILIFSSIIAATVLFLLADFISLSIFNNPSLIIFLKVLSFVIPSWVFSILFFSIINAFEKVKASVFFNHIIQNAIKVIAIILLIFLGIGTNSIIFSTFLAIFITFLLAYFYCKNKLAEIFVKSYLDRKEKSKILNPFISYSWPVMFLSIITIIFYWIDSFLLGYLKTATEVGYYNAAVPIALLLAFAPELFLNLLFPIITKDYAKKKFNLIKETTKQIAKWIFIINIPLLLLIIVFPEAIINILFGAEYLVAANALRILSFGGLVSSLFVISNNLLSMIGKSRLILFDIVLATAINIILNWILIPLPFIFGLDNSLGLNGAAIATVISVVIFNLLFVIQAGHYTSIIPLRRKMLNVFLISLIPLAFLLIIRKLISINALSIILLTIFFFALYFFLLLILRAFDRNDLMIIKSLQQKIHKKN